jgi:tRNA threonylcarbamoyl adenosine modification protein YeaZ
MLGLVLETSTEKGLIALVKGKIAIASKPLLGGPELSKSLALEVKNLLNAARPDFIAIGTGPGSYTGVRVGAALAKALSFAWRIPLVGFCSLQAFAPNLSTPVLVDARMGGFYVLKQFDKPPLILTPGDAEIAFRGAPLLASPHPALIQKRLSLKESHWVETAPDPHFLAVLADRLIQQTPPPKATLSYLSGMGSVI